MSIAGGPIAAGELVAIENVDQLLEMDLPGLEIADVEVVDLGGVEATRFDVTVAADAVCTLDDPCEYAFTTSTGVTKELSATQHHRIWWIDDHPHGPAMMIAMSPKGDEFIPRATDLVNTINFN